MTDKEIATVESLRTEGILSLKDSHGNPRFVEGDITMETIEGVTQNYGKWSLSGTHLMIVVAGSIASGTIFNIGKILAKNINIPDYIKNKIKILYPKYDVVDIKNISFYDIGAGTSQSANITLCKNEEDGVFIMTLNGAFTATLDRNFRIQFDLLIDTE